MKEHLEYGESGAMRAEREVQCDTALGKTPRNAVAPTVILAHNFMNSVRT